MWNKEILVPNPAEREKDVCLTPLNFKKKIYPGNLSDERKNPDPLLDEENSHDLPPK